MDDNSNCNQQPEDIKRSPHIKALVGTGCIISCILFAVAIALTISSLVNDRKQPVSSEQEELNKRFEEINYYLENCFMGEPYNDEMLSAALQAYVAALGDPYTQYMPKSYAEGFINGNYGNKSGIGVHAFESTDPVGIYIRSVIPGSPAEKAGLLENDIIIVVNNTVVTHEKFSDAIDMISGEEGTAVTLTVLRGEQTLIFNVLRGEFSVSPVEYKLLDNTNGIAYIRIDGVSSNSANALKEAIIDLKGKGAVAYIFDVRDDGGGYLNEVSDMLDMLLPEGPIVRYSHKSEGENKVINSDAEMIVDAPMAVLINGNTASAAELFASALKDYKKATLVGENSFGKGVMQTLYKLTNGDYIKITTGEYSPPFSENFNGVGIKPDIEVSLPDGKRYFQLSNKEDTQLQAAIDLLKNQLGQD